MTKDLYQVIVTGRLVDGFERKKAVVKLATWFQQPEESVEKWLQGSAVIIKKDLEHAKAYRYQQKLLSIGIEAQLKRIAAVELEPAYSLVPEGEESTSYADLKKRLDEGEKVRCLHCQWEQPLAPYCSQCGKQLVAKSIPRQDEQLGAETSFSHKRGVYLLISLCILSILVYLGFYYFL